MGKLQTLKLMIQMNKMTFDSNYMLMMNSFEENNFLLYAFLKRSPDIPAESKSAIEKWLLGYGKGCEDLKKMADDGYQMIGEIMSSAWE